MLFTKLKTVLKKVELINSIFRTEHFFSQITNYRQIQLTPYRAGQSIFLYKNISPYFKA